MGSPARHELTSSATWTTTQPSSCFWTHARIAAATDLAAELGAANRWYIPECPVYTRAMPNPLIKPLLLKLSSELVRRIDTKRATIECKYSIRPRCLHRSEAIVAAVEAWLGPELEQLDIEDAIAAKEQGRDRPSTRQGPIPPPSPPTEHSATGARPLSTKKGVRKRPY